MCAMKIDEAVGVKFMLLRSVDLITKFFLNKKRKSMVMRRFLFLVVGIISGALAIYFFSCAPREVLMNFAF
jgi:hypothetical protein